MPNPPKLLTVGSESLTLNEWSARRGVPATTIRARLKLGWSPKNAVSIQPERRFRPTTKPAKGVARPRPRLRRHKGTNQAYCEWITAGKWQSEETEQTLARFQLE
jgi:hypothetical protein